jgi:hypothetical protein
MSAGYALEHGTSRLSRWLRPRRVKIAVGIALVEGLLIVVHALPKWPALVLAAIVVGGYLAFGRRLRSDTPRQFGWIAASSQAMLILIPVAAFFVTTLALIILGALAVVALYVLFVSDRR